MKTATLGNSDDLFPNAATSYSDVARPADEQGTPRRLSHWFYDVPPTLWAGAGIEASAEDVARWIITLSDGRLGATRNVQAMWEAEPPTGGGKSDWAAGWAVLAARPARAVAGIGGTRVAFVVYPDARTAVVVLTHLVGANPERCVPAIAKIYEDGH